jgi:hypothetical protein
VTELFNDWPEGSREATLEATRAPAISTGASSDGLGEHPKVAAEPPAAARLGG